MQNEETIAFGTLNIIKVKYFLSNLYSPKPYLQI